MELLELLFFLLPTIQQILRISVHWQLAQAGWAFNAVVFANPRKAPARLYTKQ
jgi:hypothetical protein